MKKRIKYILFVIMLFIFCNEVVAFSVSKNSVTVDSGGSTTVELYADVGDNSVNKITFLLIQLSYDIDTYFYPATGISDTNGNTSTHTLTLSEAKNGRIYLGNIKITAVSEPNATTAEARVAEGIATTTDGENINLTFTRIAVNINKVAQVTTTTTVPTTTVVIQESTTTHSITTKPVVTTQPQTKTTVPVTTKVRENKGLLKAINSKIVTINLEDNVYEYTVNVNENLNELDLVPVASDEKTKIEISSQKISELEDKQIIINVSNQDIKEKYVIKVNLIPKPTVKPVTIDNSKFVEKNGYKGKWIVVIVLLGIVLIFSVLFLSNKKK